MARLKDIAEELGLSPATVSRALNGFPEVNALTREKVEQAAEKLGYRPNQLAKKLVTGRSGMVGLVLKASATTQTDSGFYEIMFGLSDELARRNMDLVFHASTSEDMVAPYRRLVSKNILDGFILNAPEANDPRIAYLEAEGIPFVVHGRTKGADYAYYDIDNFKVAADAVSLLADLGHDRIAFINGLEKHSFARQRARGFHHAMAEAGLPQPDFALVHGPATEDAGYTAALGLLSGRRNVPPTALICASTAIAAGAYRAARDLGLDIPRDLSVVAHDDASPQLRSAAFEPALTVTYSPMREACEPLAMSMAALLDGTPAADLETLVVAEMIVRGSTGPAPQNKGEGQW